MLGYKQDAKFGGVMSAQNTHHIPAFDHIFGSFHLVIRALIVVYLILRFLCISGEKGGTWKLCGDVMKEIGEPSLNVTTFQRHNVLTLRHPNVTTFSRRDIPTSPTSRRRDIVTLLGFNLRVFFDILKRKTTRTRREGHKIQDKDNYTG